MFEESETKVQCMLTLLNRVSLNCVEPAPVYFEFLLTNDEIILDI
jgi:hypothetical protein